MLALDAIDHLFHVLEIALPIVIGIEIVVCNFRAMTLGNDLVDGEARSGHEEDRTLIEKGRDGELQSPRTSARNYDVVWINHQLHFRTRVIRRDRFSRFRGAARVDISGGHRRRIQG